MSEQIVIDMADLTTSILWGMSSFSVVVCLGLLIERITKRVGSS